MFKADVKRAFKLPISFDGRTTTVEQCGSDSAVVRSPDFYYQILKDADAIGWSRISVMNLDNLEIHFQLVDEAERKHDLLVCIPSSYPNEEISRWTWDLPKRGEEIEMRRYSSLQALYDDWELQIQSFTSYWNELELLDAHTWILDPPNPRKSDLYRRFVVSPGVSAHVSLNLKDSMFPRVNLLGPESKTATLRARLSLALLDGNPFPMSESVNIEDYNLDCGICYCYRLCDVNEEPILPNKTCDDTRCSKSFHEPCLFEYLRTHPEYYATRKKKPPAKCDSVILVSMCSVVKRVSNLRHLSKILTSFDVIEQSAIEMESTIPNLKILINTQVIEMNPQSRIACTNNGMKIEYEKACLCLGARPNMPFEEKGDHNAKLASSKRLAVIGNGGIAAELVYSLKNVDVLWAMKDDHLISAQEGSSTCDKVPVKRMKFSMSSTSSSNSQGAALGPDWHSKISIEGSNNKGKCIHIEKSTEIKRIFSAKPEHLSECQFGNNDNNEDWNVYIEFTNGKVFGVDFIVSATGVIPNGDTMNIGLKLTENGIDVDENMRTNLPFIYAAGDVCNPIWMSASSEWFQMRLWTQARQMGAFAGIRMADEEEGQSYLDFCFELFSHVTTFFGYKVILLGLYNAQHLNQEDYEIELRITEGKEFVKIIKSNGRLKGAVLIGETDLEETFENLILNQLNIDGIDILDPIVDIDDYFD
ncbi:Pyridine nucleotide-disulfide oxidoreductase domain-containing protein 1 [Lepeophtheirus salmonis]|uniref:Pyridine nucleotide-disulfide oxidoreductase domain-containing protein 1 n=1 Tax=Lepeophtheirus salmonis TaxID=72036 RepID=A0A7R8H9E8_LEPSM|nr:Pyridine nucleotide-disulfide oxidoreductase domain-containing protein 1 [Lepeophtheirus salmonis]CAF2953998.1 Pyridine nucleotide-disulfide oxidoreductase domain-containing protein 1 [Lepeophtheirus salmonis]